jgi:hypothetical protein
MSIVNTLDSKKQKLNTAAGVTDERNCILDGLSFEKRDMELPLSIIALHSLV